MLLTVLALLWAGAAALLGDDNGRDAAGQDTAGSRPELPGGGRQILPDRRVIALYGAPQSPELGALGIGSPASAAERLRRQARPYERGRRPVLLAFELIASIANADPGEDGMYRTRQSPAVIRRYLRAARRAGAILILDIQPGHGDFLEEIRAFDEFLREPDVSLALDPEWSLRPPAAPGTEIGSTDAETVNEAAYYLSNIVRAGDLPEKLLVVHQFTEGMITGRERLRRDYPGVELVLNVDGFGTRELKEAKYRDFTRAERQFTYGFKLFYEEDTGLMSPRQVLALRPAPALVVYE